ncbi:hypothetical protein R3P38DRAFT_3292459 [Favolaschia claudopus]|uniref:Uncharacterized protein n=1 Tax=Favolaschia claudopus TaxID=2862362 RepID=A0AAV9ZJ03_9AGAR
MLGPLGLAAATPDLEVRILKHQNTKLFVSHSIPTRFPRTKAYLATFRLPQRPPMLGPLGLAAATPDLEVRILTHQKAKVYVSPSILARFPQTKTPTATFRLPQRPPMLGPLGLAAATPDLEVRILTHQKAKVYVSPSILARFPQTKTPTATFRLPQRPPMLGPLGLAAGTPDLEVRNLNHQNINQFVSHSILAHFPQTNTSPVTIESPPAPAVLRFVGVAAGTSCSTSEF